MLPQQNAKATDSANRKARRAERRRTKKDGKRVLPSADISASVNRRGLLQEADRLRKESRWDESERAYRQVLTTDPACSRALLGLGLLFISLERPKDAYEHLKQAVALEPDNPNYWGAFGRCLRDMGQIQAAVVALTRAVTIAPEKVGLHTELGLMLVLNGEGSEALEVLDRAVMLDPDYAEAHYYRGIQQNALGDLDAARSSFRRVLEIDPAFASAYLHLAGLLEDDIDLESMVSAISRVIETGIEEPQTLSTLHFAIAGARKRQKQYDEAFTHYAAANQTLHSVHRLDRDSVRTMVDEIIEGFQPGVFDSLKDAASDSDLPIFIVGMPRSGSTLVEQIISSHRDVGGAGEFPKLWRIASLLNEDLGGIARYPQHVGNFAPEDLVPLGGDYLDALRHSRPESALRITDKFLDNFLNIGLIAVLFPNASIVHCRRDPVDTCLSCYFQNFTQGDRGLVYTNDLDDLGFFYRQYTRLMAHWRDVLPGAMFEVDYEQLVADQEGVSRKLIDHIGLPWDDACLDFHKSTRSAITASISQVRKPVYNSSVAAWKKYEKHLEPLKRALGLDD